MTTPDARRLHVAEVALRAFARSATGPGDRPQSLAILLAEYDRRAELITGVLAQLENRYVESLNAVLAVPGGRESDDDLNRWRGHAEAYRQACELIRRDVGLPAVRYQSGDWRQANGVYEPGQHSRGAR